MPGGAVRARGPPRVSKSVNPGTAPPAPDREEPAARQAGPGNRPACSVAAKNSDHPHTPNPTALPEGPPTFVVAAFRPCPANPAPGQGCEWGTGRAAANDSDHPHACRPTAAPQEAPP